jgi:hypothetical protein
MSGAESQRTSKGRLVFHNGMPDCADCLLFICNTPMLVEACASVGIEHGKNTGEMAREVIASYHFGGHRDQ